MEDYANSLTRKHRKPGDRSAGKHDDSEQVRKLRELQHSLAERIRNHQSGDQHFSASDTA